jgi:glycosyltransferase involved in cell wall biosynthesis
VIYYLPLEPYPERYTELLTNWTITRFNARGVPVTVVLGQRLPDEGIRVGQVLDAAGRSHFALTQVAELVKALPAMTCDDVIYFDDMFTPGYEALPYILMQLPVVRRPRIFARNHAQSVDPDDFTFPMREWMRHFEQVVYRTATGIICASTVHKELMEVAMLDSCPIHVLGLPYDENDVRRLAGPLPGWHQRPRQVVYSSRLDREKQPHFFMDIVDRLAPKGFSFHVCTGSKEPRSNDPSAVERLLAMEAKGRVTIHRATTKARYYEVVKNSRVQLNTARQDFVSYTAIEASSLGTYTLAPAFRSFPETFDNNADFLYVPWSVQEACEKLELLATLGPRMAGDDTHESLVGKLSAYQHAALDRIIDLLVAP